LRIPFKSRASSANIEFLYNLRQIEFSESMASAFKISCIGSLTLAVVVGLAGGEDRSIDGSSNNVAHPDWGMAGNQFSRIAAAHYADGMALPMHESMPNARMVSNTVCAAAGSTGNAYRLSDFVWQWGQFIDHDLTLSVGSGEATEAFSIEVEEGDPLAPRIPMMRTIHDPATGMSTDNPREQINSISSYLDASMVYGSVDSRASWLRTYSGGRLRSMDVNGHELLPLNTDGFPNANDIGAPEDSLFLAGDVRCNEQLGLIAMHTIFLREHNRLAGELANANPTWTDEQLYQRSRKIVGALVQAITYQEFLPALLGPMAPDLSSLTYQPEQEAVISNEFASAVYRIGHTMVPEQLLLMNGNGSPTEQGHTAVADSFFVPERIVTEPAMVDHLLKGLSMHFQENVDSRLVDSFRNHLFGAPGSGGLDLAALNIQRGRDHGLADYNTVRMAAGLEAMADISAISSDPVAQSNLMAAYSDVDHIDLWVGLLSEDHMPGSAVGELAATVIALQFKQLAAGDRFFFTFDSELDDIREALLNTRLCDVLLRNSSIGTMQANVFRVPELVNPEPNIALNRDNGDVTLSIITNPGQSFRLQRSSSVADWETIGTGLEGNGILRAHDTGALHAFNELYYRFVAE
jgi:peroxidase